MRRAGIVAFAFGAPHTIPANQKIAEIAEEMADDLDAPIFTQRDVRIRDLRFVVSYATENLGEPPPTLRIAREAVQWAKRNGLEELWIVAAEPHIWRCRRDLRYATREAKLKIQIWVSPDISMKDEHWFSLASTQERTRSKENWGKRERIVRLMPIWLYKLVAS